MADTKISALTAITETTNDDFMVLVNDPLGTPSTRKITVSNFLDSASIVASQVSDFDTEVSNNSEVSANTTSRHDAATLTDSSTINFTLNGQNITASTIDSAIDHDSLLNFSDSEHFTQSAISIVASQVSDFDTEVGNNTTVTTNTAHITSNGSDHTYIDQDVSTTASPEFANLKVTADGKIQVANDSTTYIKYNSTSQQWEFYVGDTLRGAF